MTSYNDKLKSARTARKQRVGGVFLVTFLVISLLIGGLSYVNRIYIDASFETEKPIGGLTRMSGFGVLFGQYYFPLFGGSVLLIDYLGYEEHTASLSSADAGVYRPQLVLLDKQLTLEVESEVTSAIWMIDGAVIGFTEKLTVSLKPGSYRVSFEGEGVRRIEREIHLLPDEKADSQIFSPLTDELSISIRSTPSNAAVVIEDEIIGYTPLDIGVTYAYLGSSVDLLLENYTPIKFDLKPDNGVFEANFIFEHKSGETTLNLNPSGGALIVNGAKVEAATSAVGVKLYELINNSISYSKFGYKPFELATLYSESIDLDLEPITSLVKIDASTPSWVKFDNVELGQTPVELKAQIGEHSLVVSSPDYATQTITFDVFEGAPSSFDIVMETLFEFRDRNSPSSYKNSVGQLLHKIKGLDMTIGAPTNQKGQRANEVLQPVGFIRKFYISESEVSAADYAQFAPNVPASKMPINRVSWLDAIQFCNWLSLREGFDQFYVINGNSVTYSIESMGYRLPSEAEWEFIARANEKRNQTIFVWGDKYEINEVAGNIADASAEGAAASIISTYNDGNKELSNVMSFPSSNRFFDLSGNVSEMVTDHYSLTPPVEERKMDHIELKPSKQRVLKGSNYLSASWTELRASFREGVDMNVGRADVGFRIARYVH